MTLSEGLDICFYFYINTNVLSFVCLSMFLFWFLLHPSSVETSDDDDDNYRYMKEYHHHIGELYSSKRRKTWPLGPYHFSIFFVPSLCGPSEASSGPRVPKLQNPDC